MSLFFPAFASLLVRSPILLVWLTGIVLSLVFWKRHPFVSGLTLGAFLGFLIVEVVHAYLVTWLPSYAMKNGMSAANISALFATKAVIQSVVEFFLWVLIAAAIFGWRKQTP